MNMDLQQEIIKEKGSKLSRPIRRYASLAWSLPMIALMASCNGDGDRYDASGSFEAVETIVSAEAAGVLESFAIEEGQVLEAGQLIGYVDSTQLYLKKRQLEAQMDAVLSHRPDVQVQLASLQEQLKTAEREQVRISNLVKADAVPTKQLDDVNAEVAVVKRKIAAQRSALLISSDGLSKEALPLGVQVEQVEDQLRKSRIYNPIPGTVLVKYAEEFEMTAPGKPLYKIADLETIILRAYITGDQLPVVKLGQEVTVLTDDGSGGYSETAGTVTYISSKAEFTPKTIQTKDERANMVYATKVMVDNDGRFKIGMYGEIRF
jgi:HlyD family secretion protein